MAVQTINYDDKQYLNQNADIPATNKVQDTDMNEIKSVVNNNAQETINITGQILWTNPNPTSNFSAQAITLSSSDYDMYEILFITNLGDSTTRINTSGKLIKGYGTRLGYVFAGSTNPGANVCSRWVDYVSDTELTFATGYLAYGTTTRIENNGFIVPVYIIGYKTGLFN
jgi:hypothetical protein